jgi:hypothetical protein
MEEPMKIAVCFHGQMRTGVKASKSIKNFLGDLFDSIDFYTHTWDVNTTRMPLNLVGYEPPTTFLIPQDHEEFKKIYQPINYYVECQKDFWDRIMNMHGSSGDLVHLWHSAYHSNQFKRTFEEANKINYDYVIRLRPDCIFPPDRRLADDLEEVSKNPSKYYILQLFGDSYQIATSKIMDTACNFYLHGNFYGKHFWPMPAFEQYMKENNIEVCRFQDNRATILRKEFDYLDPIQFYWQINAVNSMIYENINFSKSAIIYTYENLKNPNWLVETKENLTAIFGDKETPASYFTFYKDLPP